MTETLTQKPLAKHVVGISVSMNDEQDSRSHGLDSDSLNRMVATLARHLLSQGARLVFGHDWRPDGVMQEILKLTQNYLPQGVSPDISEPLVTNFVPWPTEPYADPAELNRLKGKLTVERIELPAKAMEAAGYQTK
ncbi:MAG TPA: hypothetical protein EYG03_27285 [Planctomycetes bacterium]|nr:hypothetical protein [Fuerstiella sp.]HIK95668.1 hypothetical protein [Planctomycetota bacterium]